MDKLLSDVGTLMRYFAAGFIALIVAWTIKPPAPDHLPLVLYGAGQSWWPVLILAAAIGMLVYVVHATVLTPTLLLAVFYVAWKTRDWAWPKDCKCLVAFRERAEQRWLRRWAANGTPHAAIQRELDNWSAMIHLLYCSAWVAFATPSVMGNWGPTRHACAVYLGGALLLLLAFTADFFKIRRELWVQTRWPISVSSSQPKT